MNNTPVNSNGVPVPPSYGTAPTYAPQPQPAAPTASATPTAPAYAAPAAPAAPGQGTQMTMPAYRAEPAKKGGCLKTGLIILGVIVALIALITVSCVSCFSSDYNTAMEAYNNGDLHTAGELFESLGDYKDSIRMTAKVYTELAEKDVESGNADEAYTIVTAMMDSNDLYYAGADACYSCAGKLFERGDYWESCQFYDLISTYKDSSDLADRAYYNYGIQLYREGNYQQAQDDVFSKFDASYEEVELYYNLCDLGIVMNMVADEHNDAYITDPAIQTNWNDIYEYVKSYADTNEDAYKACTSGVEFYFLKFSKAVWKDGSNTLSVYLKGNDDYWMIMQNVQWKTPSGNSWNCEPTSKGLKFTVGDQTWFTVTGFSESTDLHPEEVYILGSDGKSYTYKFSKVK